MKNYRTSNLAILLLLLITSLFIVSSPLMASSTLSRSEHEEKIAQYVKDLRTLQEQIVSLFENATNDSPKDVASLNSEINYIYSKSEEVEKSLLNYITVIPKLSPQRRDLLIALVALNSVENSLYQFTQFLSNSNSVERALLLEDFFFLRNSTTEALNNLENILSRPN